MKIQDDDFTKGLTLIRELSFTEVPSLTIFDRALRKYLKIPQYQYGALETSRVTTYNATAIYKAFYNIDDCEHRILFLLFLRQDEKTFKTVYVVGKKVINTWEKSWESSPLMAQMDGKLGEFKNQPFANLGNILKIKK